MTGPIDRFDRFATILFRLCLTLPGIILAFLIVGILTADAAEPDACNGRDLRPALRAEGKLAGVEAKAVAVPNGAGKLFRVERAGLAPSHLFGTIHLTDPRVLALPAPAEDAFTASERLVIETTDVLDPVKAAAAFFAHPELINLPKGQTLADLVDPQEQAKLETALAAKGIPFQSIQTLQPWFTSLSLMLPDCEAARKKDGASVLDVRLAERAIAAGKPVEGLETSEEQLRALASLSTDLQVDSLLATIDLQDRMPDVMETMLALYREGKIATIMPAIEAAVPDGGILVGAGKGYAEFEERVVTERNHRMAERMRPMLEKGGAFVATGALHLPGEDGLVALLREAGWTVTRAD